MDERDVSIGGVTPDHDIYSYEDRLHMEQDNLYDPKYTDDRWYWRSLSAGSSSFTDYFTLNNVAGGSGRVRTLGYGPYNLFHSNNSLGHTPNTLHNEITTLALGTMPLDS